MQRDEFARKFEALYRLTYAHAVRRIRDKRDRLSPETLAILTHLSISGPLTLSEIARHTDRAQSTTSEMINHLVQKSLLERDRDPDDGRSTLIWLSPQGQEALLEAQKVLDLGRIALGGNSLSSEDRARMIGLLEKFTASLSEQGAKNE